MRQQTILLLFFFFANACTEPSAHLPKATAQTPADTAVAMTVAAEEPPPTEPEPEPEPKFTVEYLMGRFDPAQHPDFAKVDKKHADGEGHYLRRDAYESFARMWEAARADGITLTIISATRNFERQRSIWEGKWTGQRLIENGSNAAKKYPDPKARALKILEYSSMPGTSRHHWGTDIDLNDLDNFTFEQGPGKPVYDWLLAHAHEYGFCQPYTRKGEDRPHGYNEEKWHWSYTPVAKQLTDLAARNLTDDMIGGFKGAETAADIKVVQRYVLGINPDCL
jgi:LAS superfamily LD-carboxypeptidase LdcB